MHPVVQHIPQTQDFKLRLTDQSGVAKDVDITAQVSSTELKHVVEALLRLVPPHKLDSHAIQRWFNSIP
jgi:hypothetical protein